MPQAPAPYPAPAHGWDAPQPDPAVGRAPSRGHGDGMFPDWNVPQDSEPRARPTIALEDALKGTGVDAGNSSNPLVAAATDLLILLGRLRTGLVALQVQPLMEHVTREIETFERNVQAAGVRREDVEDGKYALAATADDIVQNHIAGANQWDWQRYSMVARFFTERNSGQVFFERLNRAMQVPGQRHAVLELMLVCMQLGFEGQYRTGAGGAVALSKVRVAVYETLRGIQPRPNDDLSERWMPVVLGGRRRHGGPPVWLIAGIGAGLVVALYATLATLLAQSSTETVTRLTSLHSSLAPVTIQRSEPEVEVVAVQAPVPDLLEQVRTALAGRIDDGEVEVLQQGEYVLVRVGEALRFASGSWDLQENADDLIRDIAGALEPHPGPIRVVGHTDSVGSVTSNQQLSERRAQSAAEVLAGIVATPERIETVGRGPDVPIASNETVEGRAKNRRVEFMIELRQDT